jgi:hypothetical protein
VRQVAGKSKSPYEQARDDWYLDRLLDGPTKDFIDHYNDNHKKKKKHKTIFLFPGGMACLFDRPAKPPSDAYRSPINGHTMCGALPTTSKPSAHTFGIE